MATGAIIELEPGRVYRTAHLARWGANPTRLAGRLQADGLLRKLSHGLFYAPRKSRFGEVPPSDEALLDAFFDGTPWLLTGPVRWNSLGLGSTQLFAIPLVYNTLRTGSVRVGEREFRLRRVAFPIDPPPEWFVIDLLRNTAVVGMTAEDIEPRLRDQLQRQRLSAPRLIRMASQFGRRSERDLVRRITQDLA